MGGLRAIISLFVLYHPNKTVDLTTLITALAAFYRPSRLCPRLLLRLPRPSSSRGTLNGGLQEVSILAPLRMFGASTYIQSSFNLF